MDAMKHLAASAVLLGAMVAADTHIQVTDPAAPAPSLRYESVLSDYRPQKDIPLLPWKNLFTEDGDFSDLTDAAPTEVTVRKPQNGHRGHDSHGSGRKATLDAQTDTPATR
ncbi:MAG: hypothetical protein FJ122_15110 [Deltaproteobacteria bacterium]|nr:hypothetical protein [Deltaproteobacteria bacterium]